MHGPRFAYGPRPRFDVPHRARPIHFDRTPGVVHGPRMMGPRGPMHPMGPRGPMKKPGQP